VTKKTKKQISKQHLDIRKAKWEFLRRNKWYQKDFDEHSKEQRIKLRRGGKEYKDWKLEKEDYFLNKWEIAKPTDYKKSTEELGFMPSFVEKIAELCIQEDYTPYHCRNIVSLRNGELRSFDWHVGIKVNLNYPKQRIMPALEQALDKVILARQKEFGYRSRLPLSEYERYCRIYDLKKQGKTYKEIALIVFRAEKAKEYDRCLQKSKEGYKQAKRLIDGGGWVRIR